MERPSYIPQEAWDIMTDYNKQEFFKNQKVKPIIAIDSDSDEINIENVPNVEIKLENVNLENFKQQSISNKKKQNKRYIDFYKNKIFELKHGYWQIRNNWRREQLQLVNEDNTKIPNKVYNLYYEYPININNITYYKLFVDGREINKFNNNILLNEWNEPREYIILIFIKNNKYPICYEYKFSDYSQYNFIKNIGYITDLNKNLNKNLKKQEEAIKHFEAQIFILEHL
tara:strand:- start:4162 stop:4845 length:684 start_codon:yes stop_codon:yes gene_type:complete